MSAPNDGLPPGEPAPPGRPRPWSAKFGDCFRGLRFAVRGQSSFGVHFAMGLAVILAAALLGCSPGEWALLLFAIGLVLTAELVNTSIETLFRGLDPAVRERSWRSLDIAAAAVLVASLTAAAVGILVFSQRIQDRFFQSP